MSWTLSARIPTELHKALRERCNQIGEPINDFVKAAIELALHNYVNFDFGDANANANADMEHSSHEANGKKGSSTATLARVRLVVKD